MPKFDVSQKIKKLPKNELIDSKIMKYILVKLITAEIVA
jgi:hypothetical protein